MAIDLSSTAESAGGVTKTDTTNAASWTLVTFPAWCRVAWVTNNTGAPLLLRQPSVPDTTAYVAGDDFPIPDTVVYPIDLSPGRGKPTVRTVSLRTASAVKLAFRMLP